MMLRLELTVYGGAEMKEDLTADYADGADR